MRTAAIPLFGAYALASGIALAQGVSAPPRAASATNNWVVHGAQYAPIVHAHCRCRTPSREGEETGD